MWLDCIDMDDEQFTNLKWWGCTFQEWVDFIQGRCSLFSIEETARVYDVYNELQKDRSAIMDEQRGIRQLKHFKHVDDVPEFSKIAFVTKMYIDWVPNDTLKSKLNWKLILE